MSQLKRYNGTSWEVVGGVVTGDTLPVGSEVDYDGASVPAGWEEVDNDLVVDSIRTKNMFDETFTQGHHTSKSESNRICNVGLLPIKSKSGGKYTLSTNLPSTYKWKLMNCSTNQLNPTIYNDTNYTSSGKVTIACSNNGYIIILVAKNNDSDLTPASVSSYNFQIEEGENATSYASFQNLNPDIEGAIDNRFSQRLHSIFKSSGGNTSITVNLGTIDRQTLLIFGTTSALGSVLSVITSSTSTTNVKNNGTVTLTANRSGNVLTIGGLTTYSYMQILSYDVIS